MKKKRNVMTLIIIGVLVMGCVVSAYANAAVLNYRNPNGYDMMICTNQSYTSTPKALGVTEHKTSDYPIYYRTYVHTVIYDIKGNVNKSGSAYGGRKASVSIKATSKAKAYSAKTTHNVDKSGKRYISSKYLTTYFSK